MLVASKTRCLLRMQFYAHNLPPSPMDPYSPPFSPVVTYVSPNGGEQPVFYPQGPPPIQVDDVEYDANIHPYWRDRVVPRPGFKSSRTLGPTPESIRIIIKNPNESKSNRPQLLPPRRITLKNPDGSLKWSQQLPPRSQVLPKKQNPQKTENKEKSSLPSPTIVRT